MASYRKYTDKTGKVTWRFQVYVGLNRATGKKKRITRSGFTTLAAAKKAAKALEAKISTTNTEYSEPSRMLLQDYFNLWVSKYKTNVKEGTMIIHRYNIKHYINPNIGRYRLDQYTARDHQDFINSLFTAPDFGRSKQGLSWNTVNVINATVSNALQKAVKLGLIETNPTSSVEFPRKFKPSAKNKKLHYWSVNQVDEFLSWASYGGRDPFWYLFFLTIFDAGLRKGEVMARRWEDIDFRTGMLTVNSTRLYRAETPETVVIDDPKTDHGFRKIPMTPRLFNAYQEYYSFKYAQDTALIASPNGHLHDKDFIFTYTKGRNVGRAVRARAVETAFSAITKLAQLPKITVHDGRHTYAVHLRQAGVPLEDIQDLLGHIDVETTRIYAEISPIVKEKAVQKLNDFYSEHNASDFGAS
ncbi:tyrosine-type recombinase/integrase [Furfurilactobacillus entadae]|uniref:tyrosine-type recombinase/integrase n=1 Tax=Furfurilactobacillus entadae TaxID=2922307 RepID=UPI0035EBEFA6